MAERADEVSKSFDAYEFLGLITPGTVVALLVMFERPELQRFFRQEGLSLGDFGIFLIVAFVLGHLVQAVATVLEPIIWLPDGLPTNWVRQAKQRLITTGQLEALRAKVARMEGADDLRTFDQRTWRAVTTRAYGQVRAAGRSSRIDTFNRTYGMARGLVAAFTLCVVGYAVLHSHDHGGIALGALAAVAAAMRMRDAGVHYARALLLEFIDLPPAAREKTRGA